MTIVSSLSIGVAKASCGLLEMKCTQSYGAEGILEKSATAHKCCSHCETVEGDNDPFEGFNRGIFFLNTVVDTVVLEPLALIYSEVVPKCARERIGLVLRNLGEPIVFANFMLQGEFEEAHDTLGRFMLNSTVGIVGIMDVSTDYGFPYRKTDLGLTFASWGVGQGPYLVLPIVGPSNIRDSWGRLGDFVLDPINMFTYSLHSTTRTGVQVVDVKTDTFDFLAEMKKHSVDYYASLRSWYTERRLSLANKVAVSRESPRPDNDD